MSTAVLAVTVAFCGCAGVYLAAIVKVIHAPEMQKRITDLGYEPLGSTPKEMADRIHQETADWTRIIKQADITLD